MVRSDWYGSSVGSEHVNREVLRGMPKIHDTRREKAAKLFKMVKNGPSFSNPFYSGEVFTVKEATAQYQRWAESWVIELLTELVPELRKAKP
jgi:hypothetical protein